MDEAIAEAISFCGIAHLRDRKLAELSGGEKQKAMLACLVCLDPKWLLLDEPFANIDGDSASDIAGKLHRLVRERGISIVAVDHKLDIWLEIADEIRVLAPGGSIAREGISPRKDTGEGGDGGDGIECLPSYGVDIPARPYRRISNHVPEESPGAELHAEPILSLTDVSVCVKKRLIVSGVTAKFARGRIHAVMGASGSGKSTLLEAVCGFRKYKGSIVIDGDCGFVFQNPQDQFVSSSVYDEIMVGLKGRSDIEDKNAEIEKILRDIGLWKYRQFSPYMLSQGEQRRLAVAALLVYRCRLLICDEPTYAQDLNSLISIMNGLKRRVEEDGLTLIFSTHDKKLARDYADHVFLLGEEGLHEIAKSNL
jgi:energy-coupling factor transport system ATP-binding protein